MPVLSRLCIATAGRHDTVPPVIPRHCPPRPRVGRSGSVYPRARRTMPVMPTLDKFSIAAEAPLHTWFGALVVSVVLMAVAVGVHRLGARVVMRIARPHPLTSVVLRYIDKPSLFVLVILVLQCVWSEAPGTLNYIEPIRDVTAIAQIAALTWLSVRSAAAIGEAIIRAHPLDSADNLQARRIH